MTLILGMNLSDRLILAADTKVTDKKTKKVLCYCLKIFEFVNTKNGSAISCAFAGNKSFAKYIATKLQEAINSAELDTDINNFLNQINNFLAKVTPEYAGLASQKDCLMIFAGISHKSNQFKPFNSKSFSDIFGPEGGRIEDDNVIFAMQNGFKFLPVPDQKIFSFKIRESKSEFEIGKVGDVYSVIEGGSTKISDEIKKNLQKIFLNKRTIEEEAKDVINLLREHYSDTIGGAITFGWIDKKGRLIPVTYDVRGKNIDLNWSIKKIENRAIAIDPKGKEHDLVKNFFEDHTGDFSSMAEM